MKAVAAIALLVGAIPAGAQPTEWVWYGEGVDGAAYHYNLPRTTYPGQRTVQTWVRWTFKESQTLPAGRPIDYRVIVMQTTIGCDGGWFTGNESYYYAAPDGPLVYSDTAKGTPVRPPPGSVADSLMRILCASSRVK
jgi:hypothetical protein